jgi:hypothetical protein
MKSLATFYHEVCHLPFGVFWCVWAGPLLDSNPSVIFRKLICADGLDKFHHYPVLSANGVNPLDVRVSSLQRGIATQAVHTLCRQIHALDSLDFLSSSDVVPVTGENRQIFERSAGLSGAEDPPLHRLHPG